MLTTAENDLLTRVGPGSPMGSLMREYWMPALRSAAVEAGGAPRRVRLLGEDLVIYRGDDRKVGALDEPCPHRGASLALARNEDCALRCIFHGTKIAANGTVLETPSEGGRPIGPAMRARGHAVEEGAGIIWVRLAQPGPVPPLPRFDFFDLPSTSLRLNCLTVECNWLQLIEQQWDPTHLVYMHRLFAGPDGHRYAADAGGASYVAEQLSTPPTLEFEPTDYGFRYARIEPASAGLTRIIVCALPWWVSIPTGPAGSLHSFLGHVPIDDTHTAWWFVSFNDDGSTLPPSPPVSAQGPRTMGTWDIPTAATDWGQDRQAMRDGTSYTGIDDGRGGIGGLAEDVAVAESMGPIVDRTREHLGASDVIIAKARRLLLEAVRSHANGAAAPWTGVEVSGLRAAWFNVPEGGDWRAIGEAVAAG